MKHRGQHLLQRSRVLEGPILVLIIIIIIIMEQQQGSQTQKDQLMVRALRIRTSCSRLMIMGPQLIIIMKMGPWLGRLVVPILQLLEHIHATVWMSMWKRQLQHSKLLPLGPVL